MPAVYFSCLDHIDHHSFDLYDGINLPEHFKRVNPVDHRPNFTGSCQCFKKIISSFESFGT